MSNKQSKFKNQSDYLAYSEREKIRARVNAKANYELRISQGECYRCGKLCGINPDTSKPFHQCLKHRLIEIERYERRKRAAVAQLAEA